MTQDEKILLSGISDEAGRDIDTQIRAHKELGWRGIELRLVDGDNVAGALSDDAFETVAGQIEDAGLQVTCFASAIGNWSRNIRDDFAQDINELKTAIPRMKRFGTRFIRTMSWVGEGVPEDEWRDEGIRRYKELAKIAEDGDVILGLENCTGWTGLSPENMRHLIESVGSDHLAVLFDTGNNLAHGFEPWPFYTKLKGLIRYVHVKDCHRNPDGGPSEDYAYPGEGGAMVRETLSDLLESGYRGVISIEPHVASIVHEGGSEGVSPEKMYNSYIRYGRIVTEMVEELL